MNEVVPTVYIVDDDESVRKSLKRLFKSVGLTAQTYSSSETFLQSGFQRKSGCLVLDIRMPGMNGIELQKKLEDLGSKLPVIFITAYKDERWHDIPHRTGAIALLYKPFDEKDLLDAVHAGLGITENYLETGL